MICPGCLKDFEGGYCRKCLSELFNAKKVSHNLGFDSPYKEKSELFHEHTQKISISGVQVKYSLRIENNRLELTDKGGEYILKPIPAGTFKFLDYAPANEHLTMQIAKQVYQFKVPPNAVIFFKDGSPAYLVKRFDLKPDGGKFQQEDFAQIAQMTAVTHGDNYKYDLSYEEIAHLIQKYIAAHRIEIEKFFRLVIFNYLFSNGDAHLKNFSAIQTSQGDYILTPFYDLLCTKIHSPGESDMALSLFKEGFSQAYEAHGFYTVQDFFLFGQGIGIKESRVEKMINEFNQANPRVYELIERSLLNDQLKRTYTSYYEERLSRLQVN